MILYTRNLFHQSNAMVYDSFFYLRSLLFIWGESFTYALIKQEESAHTRLLLLICFRITIFYGRVLGIIHFNLLVVLSHGIFHPIQSG